MDGLGEWRAGVCFVPSADTLPHAQGYEPWFALQGLGLVRSNYVAIAWIMIVCFYFMICLSFAPAGLAQSAWLVVLALSPAVQFGIERANFDLLIASMLCLAGFCLVAKQAAIRSVGFLVLGMTTALKLYTGLSCALAWIVARGRRFPAILQSALALVLAVLVLGPVNILILSHGAPEGGTRFASGAHWLFRHAGSGYGYAGVLLSLASLVVSLRIVVSGASTFLNAWPRRTALFQIVYLTAIPLFILKDSYDYRFVIWLPMMSLPLVMVGRDQSSRTMRRYGTWILSVFCVVVFAELPCVWLDVLAASANWNFARSVSQLISLVKQYAVWIEVGLLSGLFIALLREQLPRTRLDLRG